MACRHPAPLGGSAGPKHEALPGDGSQALLLIGVFSSHFSSCLMQSMSQVTISSSLLLSPGPSCSLFPPGGRECLVPSQRHTAPSVSHLVLTLWVAQPLQRVRSESVSLQAPGLLPPWVLGGPCPGWRSDEGQRGWEPEALDLDGASPSSHWVSVSLSVKWA